METEGTAHKKCGLTELAVFLAAIVAGTACSICSKTMMELQSVGITDEVETFSNPLFQTFGMFVGMLFGLVMHVVVMVLRIPFPGYDFGVKPPDPPRRGDRNLAHRVEQGLVPTEMDTLLSPKEQQNEGPEIPVWMYFFLIIPSIFDLGATALCMMGLRYLDVSIYQMLRGSGIIFVALMKQHVLRDRLYSFQWVGVAYNVVSVILVGSTALLNSTEESHANVSAGQALQGVLFVMLGAFVQALQFVFEEKVMNMDIPSPPLLLIGMEGFWGAAVCLVVLYPLAFYLPGDDHGSFENPVNTWTMLCNSTTIQIWFVVYFFTILVYNIFAVLVTFMLNSVWHAILDNFRPITVWATDMFIWYVVVHETGTFGEPWTKWSFVQLVGMCVLLYGTAVYNAPNPGSIKLSGKWWHLGLKFTDEYAEIELKMEEERVDAEWEQRKMNFKKRLSSSFYGERSPNISIHTQALRGLGSPRI